MKIMIEIDDADEECGLSFVTSGRSPIDSVLPSLASRIAEKLYETFKGIPIKEMVSETLKDVWRAEKTLNGIDDLAPRMKLEADQSGRVTELRARVFLMKNSLGIPEGTNTPAPGRFKVNIDGGYIVIQELGSEDAGVAEARDAASDAVVKEVLEEGLEGKLDAKSDDPVIVKGDKA